MANKLIYPTMNPLQMFIPNLSLDSRYNSKDFEDFNFPETILPWEQNVGYCQPWQLNDTIQLQLRANVGPVNFILKTEDDGIIDTVQFDQLQQSENEPGLFIFQAAAPLAGYSYYKGNFYVQLEFGTPPVITVRSGLQNLQTKHENTDLAEYKHFEEREDVIFETGFFPSVRVRGTKKFLGSKSKKTVYEDQVLNASKLRAQKFKLWEWLIGGAAGIPDYFQDMLAGAVECSDFRLNGKGYTVPEDADMEPLGKEGYPMRSWRLPLRERYTRGSRIIENDIPVNAAMAVMVNVDSKGFGNSNTGSQTAVVDVI